jgi:hypothetical protein
MQPFVDVAEMDAYGSFRHAELVGDLGVGEPGGDQAQQFPLPGGEPGYGSGPLQLLNDSAARYSAFGPI